MSFALIGSNYGHLAILMSPDEVFVVLRISLGLKGFHDSKYASPALLTSPIPPEFRQLVFCAALSTSGEEEWASVWKLYQDSERYPAIREDFHNSFGCSKSPAVIQVRSY